MKALDSEMALLYEKCLNLSKMEDPDGKVRAIRVQKQKDWLKRRDATPYTEAIYQDRIVALNRDIQNKFYYAETAESALSLMKKKGHFSG